MKTGQLYKDKGTLIAVMTKYKVKNNFNFRVKRSDKKRYFNAYSMICLFFSVYISLYVLRDVLDYSCFKYKVSGLMLISLITWGLKEVTLS